MKQDKVAGRRDYRRHGLGLLASFVAAAASLLAVPVASAQKEPVVATVNTTVATGVNWGPGVTDACGNFYVNNYGTIYRYAAGTFASTVAVPSGYGYGGPSAIAIDGTKTHLYAPPSGNWYGSTMAVYPITNCTLGASGNFPATSVTNNLYPFYYGTANLLTVDGYGDVFFAPTQGNNPNSIAMIACGTTVGVSCNGAPPTGANALVLTPTLSAPPTSMVADAKGNVFFVDGASGSNDGKVYEIVQPTTSAASGSFTPVVVNTVPVSAVALNLDAQGNLYIVDSNGYNSNVYYAGSNTAVLYEVPLENGTLNFSDRFVVANGLGIATQPTIGAGGSIYYTPYPPASTGNLTQLQHDKVRFPATAVGSTATATVSYYFNTQETLATESVLQGASASTVFTKGTATCASQTYTIGQTCSVPVNFTPGTPGLATGGIVLADGSNNSFSSISITGVGNGPLVSIDPGTVNAYTSTLTAPVGAAVDNLGNLYVTDTTANTLTKFAAGTGTATTVSTGSLTLNAPKAVAVDSLGNLFIADTGNNRVVEVPVVQGALKPSASVPLTLSQGGTTLTLSGPQGVAVNSVNELLIADTGNNRLLLVPTYAGGMLATANVSSYAPSLNGPTALALDPSGDVFLAETGNKDVLEFAAPFSVATPTKVISGLTGPTGLATDASGSVFVVDGANIYRYPFSAGAFGTRQNIGSAISNPLGIATDSLGNLYVTDTADKSVTQLQRVQAGLQFGLVNVNTTSPSQTATVNSAGNQTVTIPSPAYSASGNTTAGFNVSTNCAGSSLVAGTSCTITASFSPLIKYGKAEEDLAILGNTSSYGPSLALIGSSAVIYNTTLGVTQTSPAPGGTLLAGSPVSFTATINTGAQTLPAGGSITFFVNGSSVGKVAVSNNAATISLPNGLPQGPAVIISATYGGDSINYAGSQGQISVAVTPLASTAALTVTGPTPPKTNLVSSPYPYNNPISANDVTTSANGPTFTLSATVGIGSSTIVPGGTVSFYQGTPTTGTLLGVGSVSQGVATITTTALRAGTTNVVENNSYRSDYTIYAVYNGDSYYAPSAATSTVAVTVVAAPPCAFAATPCIPEQTGATYTIAPTNPIITIASTKNANATGSATLSVTSYGGWTGVLNFTCSNLPKYATCNPYPGAPLVSYSTTNVTTPPTQVQFIVQTNVPPLVSTAGSVPLWTGLVLGLLLLVAGRRFGRERLRRMCSMAGLSVLLLASLAGVSGCGSGTTSTTTYLTPAGTYTINVAISAAQLDPTSYSGATLGKDINTGSFAVTLIVQ